ncbi:MAG: pyridoxal-dependent decarboxylase, exosortase A system-associated, partial [Halothiobacillaceae bacterium]
PLDLAQLGQALGSALDRWRERLPGTEFVIELGRYLVGEAGIYVTRIVDRKHSRGRDFLLCDGGMHHHLALSGNLGQVLRRNWPLLVANRMDAPFDARFTLSGPLCTPLDVLGSDQPLPAASGPGDLVVVLQSGAYAASASPAGFLSRPRAAERLVG